jgi:ribosome modulation factor
MNTKQKRKQQDRIEAARNAIVAGAGRKAYAMLIPTDGCLYSTQNERTLWLMGYKNAEREAGYVPRGAVRYAKTRPITEASAR